MSIRRKIAAVLILCTITITLLCACNTSSQKGMDTLDTALKRGYFKVGSSINGPPWMIVKADGTRDGMDVELARMLAKAVFGKSEAVEFLPMLVQDRLNALKTHQVDFVIATFSVTEPRKKIFNFSTPYFLSKYRLLVSDQSGIKTFKDLPGKKLGFVFGSIDEEFLKEDVPSSVELVGFTTSTGEFRALMQHQIDGFPSAEGLLLNYKKKGCGIDLIPGNFRLVEFAIGFEKDPRSKKLQDLIQSKLDTFKKQGELNRLESKWMQDPPYQACLK